VVGGGGEEAQPAVLDPRPADRRPINRARAARHSQMANLACYPAIALPNGFSADGTPTSMTFFARPFGEGELLAVAKNYQDATDFHLKHPVL